MSNNKQSSVEWLISQLKISTYWNTLIAELEFMDLEIDDILEQAKAMQQEQAQQYAEFCVECDRRNLPLLDFNSWIAHNETYGGNK